MTQPETNRSRFTALAEEIEDVETDDRREGAAGEAELEAVEAARRAVEQLEREAERERALASFRDPVRLMGRLRKARSRTTCFFPAVHPPECKCTEVLPGGEVRFASQFGYCDRCGVARRIPDVCLSCCPRCGALREYFVDDRCPNGCNGRGFKVVP